MRELPLWFGCSLWFAIRYGGHAGVGCLTFQFVLFFRFWGFDRVVAFDPNPGGAGAVFGGFPWRVVAMCLCWGLRGS